MLRVLLAKDLRRAWRNPLPWLINLLVPLCMTALIGLAFGGKSESGALGRIRFAVVDEDKSVLSNFLRGAANQGESGKHLEPIFMDRQAALSQIMDNKLSAAVIIPTNFMRNYFLGKGKVSLELIKNPAQSVHPAVLEELLGVVVTGLNAVSRNFQSEFPEWQAVFEGKEDYLKVSQLIERAGNKFKTARKYINPPLVSYQKEAAGAAPEGGKSDGSKGVAARGNGTSGAPAFNLFAYLLAGLAAMFLLFLANNAMTDLHRELRYRTFERYHTLRHHLSPFIASKVVFTIVLLLVCSVVMLGGGALIFRIHWRQPVALVALTLGYAAFAAGLMALLVALVTDERRAGALNTIAGMALGIVGGCAFPPQNLAAFLREHISPLLPSYWFVDTVRNLEFGSATVPWIFVSIRLAVVSLVLIAFAGFLFRRRFKIGSRA